MIHEPPSDDEMDALTLERDRLREQGLGFGTPEYQDWLMRVLFGTKGKPSE